MGARPGRVGVSPVAFGVSPNARCYGTRCIRGPALLTLVSLLLLTLGALPSARAADNFSQGNELYAAGKFAEAAAAYQTQAAHGDYSANLFYNLGNADFRAGKRGAAILNYRRALLLEPSHPEAASNLAFVRGTAEAEATGLSSTPFAWGAAAGVWAVVVGLAIGAASRTRRFAAWSVGAIGLLVAVGCVAAVYYTTNDVANTSAAIVLEDKTRALYAPADSSPLVTTLSAGDQVTLVADRGAWLYARLSGGALGWLPAGKVERLIPAADPTHP